MKRRLLLLAGTFLALLAAYMAYYYATAAEGLETVTARAPDLDDANSGGATASGDAADANQAKKGLVLQNRDQQGRLESVIRLPVWDKQDDGSYVATNPSAVIYHKQGQRTYIYADSGRIYVDEVAGGMEVRRGWMKGDVKLFLDRGAIPGRPPPSERSRDSLQRDVVRIQTPSVFFDNDKLEIKTDDRVTVFANEADIYGRGLIVRWREAPRELLLLEITHGEQMTIYSVPADMEMISLPGGGAKKAPTSQPAGAAKAAKAPPRSTEPASPAPERPSPAATGPAAATTASAPASQRNIYRAQFHKSVRVDVGSRHMHGADVLTLTFELGKEPASRSRRRLSPAARPAQSVPASQPVTTQPGVKPDTKPDTKSDTKPAAEPMIITWTGPLTIIPVGHTDNPQDDRFRIEAEGDRVVLWDSKATAICKQFTFQNPQQAGSLKGTPRVPARLIMGDGQQIACERIHFNRQDGKAHLEGPGSLMRLANVGKDAAADSDALGRIPGQPDANADRITWGQSLDVTFGRRELAAGADANAERREYIKDAHFKGDVTLVQGKSGDFVECEDLTAIMSRAKRGEYLSRAVAVGNVFARQAGTNVIADKATVNFSEAGDTGAEGRGRPRSVLAEGNVLLLDQDDPNSPLLVVTADVARGNLARRTAVLIGKPARIVQGANRFEGDEIHLAESRDAGGDANAEPHRTITVDTPGSLEFLTRKGLSGEALTKPRPIRVAWTEHMHYRSAADEAEFRGDVRLRGGRDAIDCGRMRLNFEKQAATTRPAGDAATTTRPAKRRPERKMAVNMENYSRRKIATIVADDDVVVKSERLDPAGRLIRQLRLTGDQLVYDANKSEMNVFGEGALFVADYRPPNKTRATKTEVAGGRIDRPNQVLFTWGKLMSLTQSPDDRRVIMKGDTKRGVTAVFVSGKYMQLTERLDPPPPPWPELAAGRIGRLRCDTLDVAFDDPNDQRATGRPDRVVEGGPRVGPVKSFRAEGGVNLVDGDRQRRQAVCETMTYDASTDLVKLIGSASPRSRKPASLRFEDLDTRKTQQFSGSQILWFRKGNKDRVVVKDATGAATR